MQCRTTILILSEIEYRSTCYFYLKDLILANKYIDNYLKFEVIVYHLIKRMKGRCLKYIKIMKILKILSNKLLRLLM